MCIRDRGPAWSNSLFEDNAEFGYGMLLAQKAIRKRLKEEVEAVAASAEASAEVKAACQEYLDTFNCGASNGDASDKLVAALEGCDCETCKDIVKNKDFLAKKSQWVFGGDGWAYDIGFGGVDHVLASGEDINICLLYTSQRYFCGNEIHRNSDPSDLCGYFCGIPVLRTVWNRTGGGRNVVNDSHHRGGRRVRTGSRQRRRYRRDVRTGSGGPQDHR